MPEVYSSLQKVRKEKVALEQKHAYNSFQTVLKKEGKDKIESKPQTYITSSYLLKMCTVTVPKLKFKSFELCNQYETPVQHLNDLVPM